MDRNEIYERIFSKCYLDIKQQRDQAFGIPWHREQDESRALRNDMCNLGGEDGHYYAFVMDECSRIISSRIFEIVLNLLAAYEVPARFAAMNSRTKGVIFSECNKATLNSSGRLHAPHILIVQHENQPEVYVFKEFGINKRLNGKEEEGLAKSLGVRHIQYVSFVSDEEKARSELLNAACSDDASSNNNAISLKAFFDKYFHSDEYDIYWTHYFGFAKRAKEYLSYSVTKELTPYNLYRFKKEVRLFTIPQAIIDAGLDSPIDASQFELIKANFTHRTRRGSSIETEDFFLSLLSAEWLYGTLYQCHGIDMTSVMLGYFKAIEQLLFFCISQFTYEKTGVERRIWIKKVNTAKESSKLVYENNEPDREGAKCIALDDYGNARVTSQLISDEFKWCLTLGNMKNFIGYADRNTGQIRESNRDILIPEIDDATYALIIRVLGEVQELRNGFFHKDNLSLWLQVEIARERALQAIFLILGSCRLETATKKLTDEYLLCEYIDDVSTSVHGARVPVFFVEKNGETIGPLLAKADCDIKGYDDSHNPKYSGIRFRIICGEDQYHFSLGDIPDRVSQGYIDLSPEILPALTNPKNLDNTHLLELSHYEDRQKIYELGSFVAEASL